MKRAPVALMLVGCATVKLAGPGSLTTPPGSEPEIGAAKQPAPSSPQKFGFGPSLGGGFVPPTLIGGNGGGGDTTGTYTTNKLPKGTGAHSLGDSSISDDTVNVSTSENIVAGGNVTLSEGVITDTLDTADNVAPGLFLFGRNGQWTSQLDTANAPGNRDFVPITQKKVFSFEDGVENGTSTITSAAQGGFDSTIVGAAITGSGIPNGTTVSSVTNATTLVMSASATTSATGVRITINNGTGSNDIMYATHRGARAPSIGVNLAPATGKASLEIAASDRENAFGDLRLRVNYPSQTGNALTIHDATPTDRLWVDSSFYISGANPIYGGAVAIKGDATLNEPLTLANNAATNSVAWKFGGTHAAATSAEFGNTAGAVWNVEYGASGDVWMLHNATVDGNSTVTGTLGTTGLYTASGGITSTAANNTFGNIAGARITTTLSANVNNWSPTGLANAESIEVTSATGAFNVTGIDSTGAPDGKLLTVFNQSGQTIFFTDSDVNSTTANDLHTIAALRRDIGNRGSITFKWKSGAGWQEVSEASFLMDGLHVVDNALTVDNGVTVGTTLGVTGLVDFTGESVYLGRQVLTASSGTYTPTTGTRKVLLRMCGGGGGGGGGKGGSSLVGFGGGGAAGTYIEKWINPSATITGGAFTVGAVGSGGSATPTAGSAGGDSTIVIQGTTYTAKGGAGGALQSGVSSGTVLGGGYTSGSTASDVTDRFDPGGAGFALSTTAGISGAGGTSPWGGGGAPVNTAAAGNPGKGACSGGGGGGSLSTTGQAGGQGQAGMIIVDEWR